MNRRVLCRLAVGLWEFPSAVAKPAGVFAIVGAEAMELSFALRGSASADPRSVRL